LESRNERIVREILGKSDVTDDTSQTGYEPGRFDPPDGIDRLVRIGCAHIPITPSSSSWRKRAEVAGDPELKALCALLPRADRIECLPRGHMKRKGSAVWRGGLKDGKGVVSSDSGVLSNTPYSFSTRFEDAKGTNPEELIAAAHAGCFSMALSAQLGGAGITPEQIATTSAVIMERLEVGWTVTEVHLDVAAKIPGADQAKFTTAANTAKAGCPISRLLNAKITMEARLEG